MNKSAYYNVLSILVVGKTATTVTYKLAHSATHGTFNWGATNGLDRMVIDQLEVGRKYFIRVSTDKYRTQHWTEAKPLHGKPMHSDAITQAVAKERSKPQIRQDFLDSLLEF